MEYDGRSTSKKPENINLSKLVEVRNEKAVGNKLTEFKIKQITLLDPKKDDIPEDERENEAQLLADRTDNLEFDSKGGGDGEQMGLF